MSDNNYQIKLNFCQLTLDELTNPYIHINNGCQFNQKDDQQILSICPVCQTNTNKQSNNKNQNDKIEQDDQLLIQLEQKNEKQIVQGNKNTLFFLKRRNYTYDNISKIKEVKELQRNFYSTLRQKRITLQQIQEISQQRNQQYISCLKNLSETQKIPILMAVINHRLILFYHLYKLKVELTLQDVTNTKIRQKVGFNTHGVLQQIMFVENNIYFLYLKQNISILFIGDFQQIFTLQNAQEIQFQIKQISICKLDGPSRLIYTKDKELIMIGNRFYYNLNKQTNQPFIHPLDSLTTNTLCNYFDNNQILMVNQEEDKQSNRNNLLYFCYDLSKSNYAQDPKNTQEIFPVFQKLDNYFTFGDQMLLFYTSELRNEKCSIKSISSWLPYTQKLSPISLNINVINHQSYMEPIKIISSQKCMNNITCQLIGMRLPKKGQQQQDDESDVFPALLVYNSSAQSFEVELI